MPFLAGALVADTDADGAKVRTASGECPGSKESFRDAHPAVLNNTKIKSKNSVIFFIMTIPLEYRSAKAIIFYKTTYLIVSQCNSFGKW